MQIPAVIPARFCKFPRYSCSATARGADSAKVSHIDREFVAIDRQGEEYVRRMADYLVGEGDEITQCILSLFRAELEVGGALPIPLVDLVHVQLLYLPLSFNQSAKILRNR